MIHIENRSSQLNPFSPVLRQLRQVLKQSGYNTAGIAPKKSLIASRGADIVMQSSGFHMSVHAVNQAAADLLICDKSPGCLIL